MTRQWLVWAALAMVGISAGCDNHRGTPTAPTATSAVPASMTLSASPTAILAGAPVTLTAQVADADGNAVGFTPVHFTATGFDETDDTNSGGTATVVWAIAQPTTITATAGVARQTVTLGTDQGGGVTLSLSAPSGTAGAALLLSYDLLSASVTDPPQVTDATLAFGDGATTDLGAVAVGNHGVSHTYASAGTYTATLRVTLANGQEPGTTTTVSVAAATTTVSAPSAPTPSLSLSVTDNAVPAHGTPVTFTVIATLLNGTTTTPTTPVTYEWDLNDDGVPDAVDTTGTTDSQTYTFPSAGTETIVITATDAAGHTGTVTQKVVVN